MDDGSVEPLPAEVVAHNRRKLLGRLWKKRAPMLRGRAEKLGLILSRFCRKKPDARRQVLAKAENIRKHKSFLVAKGKDAYQHMLTRRDEIIAILKKLNEELEEKNQALEFQAKTIEELESATFDAAMQVDLMETVSKDADCFMLAYMSLFEIRRFIGLFTEDQVRAYSWDDAFDLIGGLLAFGLDMNEEHDPDVEFTTHKGGDVTKEFLHDEIIKHLKIGDQLQDEAKEIMGLGVGKRPKEGGQGGPPSKKVKT